VHHRGVELVGLTRLAVAAALLVATLPSPVVARPAADALVVSGDSSGYAVFEVDREVELNLRAARITRQGRYGGIAFDDHGFVVSSADIPQTEHTEIQTLGPGGQIAFARGAPGNTLRPGIYRVYLISDGAPVTVTVPWAAPRRYARVTVEHRVDLDVVNRTVADGAWHAAIVGAGGPPGTRIYGAALWSSETPGQAAGAVGVCLTRSTSACEPPLLSGIEVRNSRGGHAMFGRFSADSRGYNVVGVVDGASPLDLLTVVALRYPAAR
jgi:hypothetical protein